VETALSFLPGIRRSAVLAVVGRRVLVVEGDESPAGLPLPEGIDELRRLDRIPVDRRHRSKIDYPRLATQLARAR